MAWLSTSSISWNFSAAVRNWIFNSRASSSANPDAVLIERVGLHIEVLKVAGKQFSRHGITRAAAQETNGGLFGMAERTRRRRFGRNKYDDLA